MVYKTRKLCYGLCYNKIIYAMNKISKTLSLLLIILLVNIPVSFAQPVIDEDDVQDNPVPFDGGVGVLVAAAIYYGLKKAHRKKQPDTF
jgi:hypothetical protein